MQVSAGYEIDVPGGLNTGPHLSVSQAFKRAVLMCPCSRCVERARK